MNISRKTRRPRVLLLFEYPTLHGGERSLLSVIEELQDAGFHFIALAPEGGDLAETLVGRGVEIRPFAMIDARGVKQPQGELRRRLADHIQALRPALIHANSLSTSRLAGPVAKSAGVRSIGHLRDILSLSRRAIEDLNQHTRLLAVSEATRAWHVAQGLDQGKTFVCYNGVDLEQFRPREATGCLHDELSLPRDARLIGSIGQIGSRKGLDVTANAMRRLADGDPALHWIVVGERWSRKEEAVEYEWRLRQTAAEPPLAGRVHFLGVRKDVDRLLNELTLLIHAARQEPLGRVVLEAAASGVPVVATDVGGTQEILPRPRFDESLVPPDDPPALAAAAAHLLNDRERRNRIAADLRRRAEEAFDARHAARRLLGHYREVLGG